MTEPAPQAQQEDAQAQKPAKRKRAPMTHRTYSWEKRGELPPTARRILYLLSDGLPHRREELHACLDDELSALSAIINHVVHIRRFLKQKGETVLCVYDKRTLWYQHVRLLHSATDGRT